MPTQIITGKDALGVVYRSLARSVRAVGATLGPAGGTVLDERGVLADGLSIARTMADETGAFSVGSRILKDTLFDAERDLGDGTARLACMIGASVRAGVTALASGIAPGQLADAMLRLRAPLDDIMRQQACPSPPSGDIAASAGADPALVRLIETLPQDVLQEGLVELRHLPGRLDGAELDRGFTLDIQPDAAGYSSAEHAAGLAFQRTSVLVLNEQLDDFAAFARVLEGFVASGRSLCIVARGFGPVARATLAANRKGLGLKLVGLVPGDVGLRALGALEDLAAATGATLLGEETGSSLAGIQPHMLGSAETLSLRGERAVFLAPGGSPETIAARSRLLTAEAERQRFLSLDREHLQRRAARLTIRWAEIRLGDGPDSGVLRLREGRAALSAIRAARDGVVPGGGVALARAGEALEHAGGNRPSALDRAARHVIAQGCRAVMRRITANAGRPDRVGIDADCPVVDPLFTTTELLRRAVSVSATLLRIEVLVCTRMQ